MPPRKAQGKDGPAAAPANEENLGGASAEGLQTGEADGVVKTPIEAEPGGGEAVLNAEETQAGPESAPAEEAPAAEGEDHITAFERYVERLQRIAEEADFESGSLVGDLRDSLLDLYRARLKPWGQLSAGEQADLNRGLETMAKTLLRKLVLVIAEEDDVSVHATLKGYQVDGETFKLKVVAKGDVDTATELFKMDGHEVILIRADARKHFGQKREGAVLPDQPGLSFADGGGPRKREEPRVEPDHPDDDSDLAAGAAEEESDEEEAEIRIDLESANRWLMRGGEPEDETPATDEELIGEWTRQAAEVPEPTVRIKVENGRIEALVGEDWGESRDARLAELRFADKASTFRVNLKTSMVERLPDGGDPEDVKAWVDVRTADSDELAAERERLAADFDQGGATA